LNILISNKMDKLRMDQPLRLIQHLRLTLPSLQDYFKLQIPQ
jgi:hypothetical protein